MKYPNKRIEYQGFITVDFRDYLIDCPPINDLINKKIDKERFYKNIDDKTILVYNYIEQFINEKNREPNTLELYQKFLNFKSYELRVILNRFHNRNSNIY